MKVDVVVCAKNRAVSLDRVLNQIRHEIPFKNLIVVYGSSLDDTKKTAEKYTNHVYWDGDRGLGAARNLGIRKATSEIVAMIDSDVVLTRGWFQQLISRFQDPQVAAVIGTCIYGHGCKPLEAFGEYLRLYQSVNVGCHNTMFRREAILKVGNFDEMIRGAGEDWDLYNRLLAAGYRWVWVREATVYHPMSMWEYLEHCGWWYQGLAQAQARRLSIQSAHWSIVKLYGKLALSIPMFLGEGLKLSVLVHPIFLFYAPLTNMVRVRAYLKELKTFSAAIVAGKRKIKSAYTKDR